ncbi:YphA family membrane protein [Ornithinibacillus halophilus]|uniref:Uncharacterized protein n=1 Tax=Ornithinibacillus halophilus TaxID=930117 RepID=A0A1M5CR65_9BACI|nr:hypothetical protein [Ornithinibacillus halophilus]SHF57213.1 hypothetical protein SAMN05216225_1001353 [Ornithinibacillus halophilus]
MEGLYFYWFSWIFWVVVTFFMKKNNARTMLSYWILLCITLSNVYISIDVFHVSVTIIILLIGGFVIFTQLPNTIYHLFTSLTLMIGYTSFLIWESQAPIWLFMPREILLPLMLVALICILTYKFYYRLSIALIGICSGEFLYSFLLSSYYFSHTIGEKHFFDTLFIAVFLLFGIEFLNRLRLKIIQSIQIYRQSLRWQNE